MNSRPPAIVIGLDCITGLQTARILSSRGVPVIGLAGNRKHFSCRTNVCDRIIETDLSADSLIATLERLGPTLPDGAVLYPCTDLSVLAISRYRQRLGYWYRIMLADAEAVETLTDKVAFLSYAQQHGLAVPETHLLRNRAEAQAAADSLAFPCILKPPLKTWRWQRNVRSKVIKVFSREEMLEQYDRVAAYTDVLLAQQWIEGDDEQLFSCNCYYTQRGEAAATFVARKIRQWPPMTGTSCLGEECRNDAVLDETVRLFSGIKYRGLGYVEMKRDARTGKHYIIEPNIGRPTGRSAIAEAGGVELLYTMYCDAVGLPLPTARVQRYGGAKWIYWRHDLQSALYYWSRGQLSLRDWWNSWKGRKATAVLSWRDPAPFFFDLVKGLQAALGAVGRKCFRSASKRAEAVEPHDHEESWLPARAGDPLKSVDLQARDCLVSR